MKAKELMAFVSVKPKSLIQRHGIPLLQEFRNQFFQTIPPLRRQDLIVDDHPIIVSDIWRAHFHTVMQYFGFLKAD